MSSFPPRRMFAAAAVLAILSAPALAFDAESAGVCQAAGTEAERLHALPAGMLLAIGRVESGRRNPLTGQVAAWPWTINAAGAGRLFESSAEAIGTTRLLRAQGVQSIDVGCFQINLLHHPTAFQTLDDAFDPRTNADYAARFLVALRTRTGSWDEAVAAYHSATPERGGPYRDRVMAGWVQGGGQSGPMHALPSPVPMVRANPLMIWTPSAQIGLRVWTPSAMGAAPSIISIRAAQGQILSQVSSAPIASSRGWSGCSAVSGAVVPSLIALKKC